MGRRGGEASKTPSGRSHARASLVLTIPSRTEFLAMVRDVTRRVGWLAGFPEETSSRLGLAVDECTTNVIKHAYHGAPDQTIEIRIEYAGIDLRVEVLDSGDTVDPRAVPKVDLDRYASERRKGGLGVHLMGKIMDSVTFSRAARRNCCTLVKGKPNAGGPGV